MQIDSLISAHEDVVAREVGGETVLLHLGSGTYFGLNAVGGRLWQLLDAGDQSIAGLCDVLAEEFDAPREVIEQDVLQLAAALVENGLVSLPVA